MAIRDEFCHMIRNIKRFSMASFFPEAAIELKVDTQLEVGLHSPIIYSHDGYPRYESFHKADISFKNFWIEDNTTHKNISNRYGNSSRSPIYPLVKKKSLSLNEIDELVMFYKSS
jgi:hypothetical protein